MYNELFAQGISQKVFTGWSLMKEAIPNLPRRAQGVFHVRKSEVCTVNCYKQQAVSNVNFIQFSLAQPRILYYHPVFAFFRKFDAFYYVDSEALFYRVSCYDCASHKSVSS